MSTNKLDMPTPRWLALMRNEDEHLTPEELASGWHFCAEWDGLLVGPGMKELECCTCTQSKELAEAFAHAALSAVGGTGQCVATEVTEFFTTGTVVPHLPERDCFVQEGQLAFTEGNERSDCPYSDGTDGQAGWQRGWDLAAR